MITEHEIIVPFDSVQNLRYLFLKYELEGNSEFNSKARYEMEKI